MAGVWDQDKPEKKKKMALGEINFIFDIQTVEEECIFLVIGVSF